MFICTRERERERERVRERERERERVRERERESTPAVAHFQKRTDWNTGKERIYYRFHILWSSYYNIYARFVLYFHLHYQMITEIASVFLKPYELQFFFNWRMHTFEQIWRQKSILGFLKKKPLKALWPSQIAVNIGHCIWAWNYL